MERITPTMATPSESGMAVPLRPALRSDEYEPMSPKSGPAKGKDVSAE